MAHQGAGIPGRVADELLHALIIGRRQPLVNPADVFADIQAQQTGQIVARVRGEIMPSRLEVRPVFLACEVEVTRQAAAADSVIFYLSGLAARCKQVVG